MELKGAGLGQWPIAAAADASRSTVRCRLLRFAVVAAAMRAHLPRWALWLDPGLVRLEPSDDQPLRRSPQPARSRRRTAGIDCRWRFASTVSGRRLLASTTSPFLWAEIRTLIVALHGNHYEVDPALVGRRVQLVFDPFDLSILQVRWNEHLRRFGGALGMLVGGQLVANRAAEVLPGMPATATGIDYLTLVEARTPSRDGRTRRKSPHNNGVRERAFGSLKYEHLYRQEITDDDVLTVEGRDLPTDLQHHLAPRSPRDAAPTGGGLPDT